MMVVQYLHWQYIAGPKWLLSFYRTLAQVLLKMFSVPIMAKTLFAAWHKDTVGWHGGTISQLGMVMGWNVISRIIGFLIRGSVLVVWLFATALLLVFSAISLLLFLLWPLLVIVGLALGFFFIFAGISSA